MMARRQVVVDLTVAQALRCEKLGECLWPAEKLSVEEISRRLALMQARDLSRIEIRNEITLNVM